MSTVAVIDYGMGNLHSIAKALQHVAPDSKVLVTSKSSQIVQADHVIFPGVGAIRDCIAALKASGLTEVISEVVQSGKPTLGICLGMQALLTWDEENQGIHCLDLIPGKVLHFPEPLVDGNGNRLKIPHMGWNKVKQNRTHPLWENIADGSRFYFVHSYFARPEDESCVAATADYPDPFACAIAKDNVFAVQFHPEKSHTAGLRLIENFLSWDGLVE